MRPPIYKWGVPLINEVNIPAHRKGLRRLWLHHRDRHCTLTQMYNNCTETYLGSGVLSVFVFPLITIAHRSQLWHHIRMRALAKTMMRSNASTISCVNERVATLFSAWKLQIELVTGLCMSPVSYWWLTASCQLPIQRILWATETAPFWQNPCVYPLVYPWSLYWTSSI